MIVEVFDKGGEGAEAAIDDFFKRDIIWRSSDITESSDSISRYFHASRQMGGVSLIIDRMIT